MKIYIFTIGFTPEFVLKPLFEIGISEDAFIIILYTMTGDEYSKKRVQDAINYIENIARQAGFANRIFFKEISLGNTFYDTVYSIAFTLIETLRMNSINLKNIDKVEVWLTGGMRILVIATLITCKIMFSYMDIPAEFHAWSEDGFYRYVFTLSLLDIELKELSKARLEILRKIVSLGGSTYDKLVNAKRKESTIRKMIELLRRDKLVYCERKEKYTICKATELGNLIIKIMELLEGLL